MTRLAKVILAHRSNSPDPISLAAGDRVTVGRTDNEYPAWIRIRLADDNEGGPPRVSSQFNLTAPPSQTGVTTHENSTPRSGRP